MTGAPRKRSRSQEEPRQRDLLYPRKLHYPREIQFDAEEDALVPYGSRRATEMVILARREEKK